MIIRDTLAMLLFHTCLDVSDTELFKSYEKLFNADIFGFCQNRRNHCIVFCLIALHRRDVRKDRNMRAMTCKRAQESLVHA